MLLIILNGIKGAPAGGIAGSNEAAFERVKLHPAFRELVDDDDVVLANERDWSS